MKLFWIPLTRIMLDYWYFNWNIWVKGSVGADSNLACSKNWKRNTFKRIRRFMARGVVIKSFA